MSKVMRYDLVRGAECVDCEADLVPHPTGDYVLYDDYAALVRQAAALAEYVRGVAAVERWRAESVTRFVLAPIGTEERWVARDTHLSREIAADSLPALGLRLIEEGRVDGD